MKTKVAVIGAGHLGRVHARLLAELPNAELTAVVDPVESARVKVAGDYSTRSAASVESIYDEIDAAIVAAPTALHHQLGVDLLSRGIHVLMEKPLAITESEADDLVDVAKNHDCILQVGHVERFNPAYAAVEEKLVEPKYIESRRMGSFTFRSLDVGVVLDLMIHDIDLILQLVKSDVVDVQALGTSVLTAHEDMAQARLTFRNGCVANLMASRVAIRAERTMSVYCPTAYAGIDFAKRNVELVTPNGSIVDREFNAADIPHKDRGEFCETAIHALMHYEELTPEECNPLQDEQRDFLAAVQTGQMPQVTGTHGRDAVAVASMVCDAIAAHQWNGSAAGPVGPFALPGPTILQTPAIFEAAREQRKAG